MRWSSSIAAVVFASALVKGQSSSVDANRPTISFNSATTDVIISTAAPQTSDVFSATGTIQSSTTRPPYVNVSSVPASVSSTSRTASSNFTLPSATATATIPANFTAASSVPFVIQNIALQDMPSFKYSLADEDVSYRQLVCDQQTQFCKTAGCAEAGATIDQNFCNVETMGVRCTCNKGSSNLQQWKWPVQLSDCLRRGAACSQACSQPGGTTAERVACKKACDNNFGATCGRPDQYGLSYAVDKQNQKPGSTMVQGGTASGALSLKAVKGLSILVASVVAFSLL